MSSTFSAGQLLGGQYRIVQQIGRGGMSAVYLAWDEVHERDVAVKALLPSLTETLSVDRFLGEIRMTAGLAHPHVLPLLHSGNDDGLPFYVTLFVRGESLREKLRRDGSLSIDESLRIGAAVAQALAHAHAEGLIHRDVKPGNVLIDRNGNPYLADFGVARALSVSETMRTTTGEIVGTFQYMSPEQFGDRGIDGTTDVYSLGCVLYEMLSGEPVFKGRSAPALAAAHLFKKPASLRTLRADVSPALDELLLSTLVKDPSKRLQTAAELARRLEDLRATNRAQSLVAQPPSQGVDEHADESTGPWGEAVDAEADPSDQQLISKDPVAPVPSIWVRYRLVAALLLVVVSVGVATAWPRDPVLSEARYAVLPFARESPSSDALPFESVLADALSRWQDVAVIDGALVEQLVAQAGDPARLTAADLLEVAAETGAGRLVRGEARAIGDSLRVEAQLLDPASPTVPLDRAVFWTRLDGSDLVSEADRAIERLLFETVFSRPELLVEHTQSVAAARQFLLGDAAREEWRLAEAEQHLTEAVGYDRSFPLAQMWRAQVLSWRGRSSDEWASDARSAAQAPANLTPLETLLANALVAMADGRHPEACDLYEGLRREQAANFAAWFGLGECRRRDPVVVRDPESRTGWSFRASAQSEVASYRRAFELLPSSFKGFGTGDPEVVSTLLLTRRAVYRQGRSDPPEARAFYGFAEWRGDSLSYVAVLGDSIATFRPDADAQLEAITRQRRIFLDVARGWTREFPSSVGAQRTLALARELAGDATALDTYREARTLSTDPGVRADIGTAEILFRLRLSLPGDSIALRAAVALGDSILQEANAADATSERLEELAVLLGRPALAAEIGRSNAVASSLGTTSADIVAEGQALVAFAAVGAPLDSIRAIEARIEGLIPGSVPADEIRDARRSALQQAGLLAFPIHTFALFDSTAIPVGPEARAIAELRAGRAEEAVQWLGDPLTEAGWDILLARASILVAAGRPATALDVLQTHFEDLATSDPAEVRGMGRVGGLVRAVELRAELERSLRSPEVAAPWRLAADILRSTSERAVRFQSP